MKFKTDRQRKAVMARLGDRSLRRKVIDRNTGPVSVVKKGDHIYVVDEDGNRQYSYSGVTGRYYGATKYHDTLKESGLLETIPKYRIDSAIAMFNNAEKLCREGRHIAASELKDRFRNYCLSLSGEEQQQVLLTTRVF